MIFGKRDILRTIGWAWIPYWKKKGNQDFHLDPQRGWIVSWEKKDGKRYTALLNPNEYSDILSYEETVRVDVEMFLRGRGRSVVFRHSEDSNPGRRHVKCIICGKDTRSVISICIDCQWKEYQERPFLVYIFPHPGVNPFFDKRKIWSSSEWKKRRDEFIEGKCCEWCGSEDDLVIHHPQLPGSLTEEEYKSLEGAIVLCKKHHFLIHEN
jgi:hypothetical protein